MQSLMMRPQNASVRGACVLREKCVYRQREGNHHERHADLDIGKGEGTP